MYDEVRRRELRITKESGAATPPNKLIPEEFPFAAESGRAEKWIWGAKRKTVETPKQILRRTTRLYFGWLLGAIATWKSGMEDFEIRKLTK